MRHAQNKSDVVDWGSIFSESIFSTESDGAFEIPNFDRPGRFDHQDAQEWSCSEFRFRQPIVGSLDAKFYAESNGIFEIQILSLGH